MQKLDDKIANCIQNTLVVFHWGTPVYVTVNQYKDFTKINVQNTDMEPSEFLKLLRKYKSSNRWLYDKIYEENAEYLI